MKNNNIIYHTIKPEYNEDSEILILGSIPSVKSREDNYYYAHPKNRFWKVLSYIFNEEEPKTIDDKKKLLKKNKVALFDVIESCTINGSSDSSIKNVKVNDIKSIVEKTNIKRIYTTGKTAYNLYNKYLEKDVGMVAEYLPSTSPANAKIKLEELIEEYKKIIV